MKLPEELEKKLQSTVQTFLKENGLIDENEGVVVYIDKHPANILDTHLIKLGLKSNVVTPMYYNSRGNIKTVGDVMREVIKEGGDNFVRSLSGFGLTSFQKLRSRFQELGLKLGPEWKIIQDTDGGWKPDI